MSLLKEDIFLIKQRIENYGENPKIKLFDLIYAFTNENFNAAILNFDLKNKDCLSVLASSDQVFDMYLNGANKVEAFDINQYTKYYFYLKKAFLLAKISKEDFFNFFRADLPLCRNKNSFDKVIFDKVKDFITDKDSYLFWNYIFNNFNPAEVRAKYLFNRDEWPHTILQKSINYLDGDNYSKLQKIADGMDINFYNLNFTELKEKVDTKFDFIYLSNIMQYALDIYEKEVENVEHKKIWALNFFKENLLELDALLKGNGTIVNYIYDAKRRKGNRVVDLRNGVFFDDCFEEVYFTSIQEVIDKEIMGFTDDVFRKDSCLIYKKS